MGLRERAVFYVRVQGFSPHVSAGLKLKSKCPRQNLSFVIFAIISKSGHFFFSEVGGQTGQPRRLERV